MIDWSSEAVGIKEIVRRMSGRSQSYLIEGEDDHFYVAKFAGNPQGSRTLVNEWVAWQLMDLLGVCTPPLRVLKLSESLRDGGQLTFRRGAQSIPIEGSFHLGSMCPVNPEATPIFDFLPGELLGQVTNVRDFGLAFVMDTWLRQADKRQAIFTRDTSTLSALKFRAHLIDHGMIFAGSAWNVDDTLPDAAFFYRDIYNLINMPAMLEQALSVIHDITEDELYGMGTKLPGDWLRAGDYDALDKLFRSLLRCRATLPTLLMRRWEELQESMPVAVTHAPGERRKSASDAL